MAKQAKKTKAKNGRKRRQSKEEATYVPGPVLMDMIQQAVQSQPRNLNRSSDARSEVLGALASVLSDVTTAVQALGTIANTAPNYSNTETRQ